MALGRSPPPALARYYGYMEPDHGRSCHPAVSPLVSGPQMGKIRSLILDPLQSPRRASGQAPRSGRAPAPSPQITGRFPHCPLLARSDPLFIAPSLLAAIIRPFFPLFLISHRFKLPRASFVLNTQDLPGAKPAAPRPKIPKNIDIRLSRTHDYRSVSCYAESSGIGLHYTAAYSAALNPPDYISPPSLRRADAPA